MKKKFLKFFTINLIGIISIALFSACSMEGKQAAATTDEISFSSLPKREYTEQEQKFIEAYDAFLQTDSPSDKVEAAAADPADNDFAIIPLEKELFGTDAFAFLPIDSRQLTEEEMMQLAVAFKGADGELILQDFCSYKYAISDELGIDSNRSMTSAEAFRFRIKSAGEYFCEGLRPEQKLGESGQEEVRFYSTENGRKIWLYPAREMTETEILQILDVQYNAVDPVFYTPKEGQLSAQDARAHAEELLQAYLSEAQKVEETYVLYLGENTPMREDCWKAFLHLENRDSDYRITFSADTGEQFEIEEMGKDFYTEEHYLERE